MLEVIEEIRSFPLRRLIRTRIAKATLASHAPNAKINIGIIKYMVEVDDRVKDSMRVKDRMDASSDRRHIRSLFRIIIIDVIDTREMINVNSCG